MTKMFEAEIVARAILHEQKKGGGNEWVWLRRVQEVTALFNDGKELDYYTVRRHYLTLAKNLLAEAKPQPGATRKKPVFVRLTTKGVEKLNSIDSRQPNPRAASNNLRNPTTTSPDRDKVPLPSSGPGPPSSSPEEPLARQFYERQTTIVARELLGKILRVWDGKVWRSGKIVETEAYVDGDPANHAFGGPNRKNASMFKGPGTVYVFVVHGVHCVNAVTRRGEAVLIRAVQPLENADSSTDGPGKLCRALQITRNIHDGLSLLGSEIIQIKDNNPPEPSEIVVSTRIGVSRAKDLPLRFFIKGNPFVSRDGLGYAC